MLSRQIHIRLGIKRGASGHHLIDHARSGVNIAAGIHLVAAHLLRRHIPGTTKHHIRLRQGLARLLKGARNPEIHHLNLPRLAQGNILISQRQNHNVCGLNIAVNNAHIVAVLQCTQQLIGVRHSLTHRKMRPRRQHLTQGAAVHQLHHNIWDAPILSAGLGPLKTILLGCGRGG